MIKKPLFPFFLLAIVLLGSCSTVPLTGRRQVSLLPESMMVSMALTSYDEFLSQNPPLPATDPGVRQLREVGQRISGAVSQYLIDSGESSRLNHFNWAFNLIDDPSVNAWAMPGGKIVFYTGILPLTQNEDGMAVVMAHEIAHAVARHGNERMSQQLLLATGGLALDVALREQPELTRNLFLLSYGVGGQLGTLAYSRQHEYEADRLGMIFMAMAGYDPGATISFWDRMMQHSQGQEPPQFLSTHPSNRNRIQAARDFLPEAMKYFKAR